MNILLSMNKGFTWKTIRDEQGIVYYKGPESLDGLVSQIASLDKTELVEFISRLPIPFAIIIDKGDIVYAVTDIARSIPIFFDSNSIDTCLTAKRPRKQIVKGNIKTLTKKIINI